MTSNVIWVFFPAYLVNNIVFILFSFYLPISFLTVQAVGLQGVLCTAVVGRKEALFCSKSKWAIRSNSRVNPSSVQLQYKQCDMEFDILPGQRAVKGCLTKLVSIYMILKNQHIGKRILFLTFSLRYILVSSSECEPDFT